jgi:hypothetical protein
MSAVHSWCVRLSELHDKLSFAFSATGDAKHAFLFAGVLRKPESVRRLHKKRTGHHTSAITPRNSQEQVMNRENEKVAVGSWVKVSGFGDDEAEVFRIVPNEQANYLENKLPQENPLAAALVDTRAGDKIHFDAPVGRLELTVIEVGR